MEDHRAPRVGGRAPNPFSFGLPLYSGFVFHILEKQIHAAFRDRLRAGFGVESNFALEQPRQQARRGKVGPRRAFALEFPGMSTCAARS